MRLRTVLLAAAVGGAASYAALGRAPTWSPIPSRPAARHRSAYASALAEPETESTLLGKVVSEEAGLVVIQPEARAEAKIGTLVNFGSGASGVLLFERCGYYFATALSPGAVHLSASVDLVGANLAIPGWSEGEGAWGGVYDYLNRPCNDAAAAGDPAADRDGVQVFADPRIETRNTHGTGCTLASAIATGLAQDLSVGEAVARARRYLRRALATARPLGGGEGPVNHGHTVRPFF